MRTGTLLIGAVTLVLAAGCNRNFGQTSTGAPSGDQAKVTLTGCLQPGEQGLASREPNSASRSAEGIDQFVLADAKMPAAASNEPGRLYVLDGQKDELRQHVGQQVEVIGEAKGSSDSPDQGNAQRFEVESVKMIAERCAGL